MRKELQLGLDSKKLSAIGFGTRYNSDRSFFRGEKAGSLMSPLPEKGEQESFAEFRRKIRGAEILSAAMERILTEIHFSGRVSVVVQNGRVLKSGYEEGYFRHHPAT